VFIFNVIIYMNFSKTRPDLVEPKIELIVQDATGAKINQNTFSENVSKSLQYFYDNYFKKYLLFLILIIVLILFLLYRYYKNKELKRVREISENKNKEKIKTFEAKEQEQMTKHIYEILKQNRLRELYKTDKYSKPESKSIPKKNYNY